MMNMGSSGSQFQDRKHPGPGRRPGRPIGLDDIGQVQAAGGPSDTTTKQEADRDLELTICAAAQRAEEGYLEFDAQPAMMTP